MDNVYYVYVLFDWFGSPRWVGKGKKGRWLKHERHSDPRNWMKNEFIERTWIMLGEIPKIKVQENLSEDDALSLEIALIKVIGRYPIGPLVNMTDGGEGTTNLRRSPLSVETRLQISKALTGRKQDPEVVARRGISISKVLKGKKRGPHTEEHKSKISSGIERMWAEGRGNPGMTGKTHSSETIQRMSLAAVGRIRTVESRRKQSESRMGMQASDATRAKMSASQLLVRIARIWITNGLENKKIPLRLVRRIPLGWWRGVTKGIKADG
jgi:hypothetical protein